MRKIKWDLLILYFCPFSNLAQMYGYFLSIYVSKGMYFKGLKEVLDLMNYVQKMNEYEKGKWLSNVWLENVMQYLLLTIQHFAE